MQNLFRKDKIGSKWLFNRERLILGAMQNISQLYFMMDTQSEGLYQTDALERKKEFGNNTLRFTNEKQKLINANLSYHTVEKLLNELSHQKISVFRRGMDFYSEILNESLVPGDIIFIAVGDIIPADRKSVV